MELLAQTLMSVTWQIRVINKLRAIIQFPDSGEIYAPYFQYSYIKTCYVLKINMFFVFYVIDVDLAQVDIREVMAFLVLDWTLL